MLICIKDRNGLTSLLWLYVSLKELARQQGYPDLAMQVRDGAVWVDIHHADRWAAAVLDEWAKARGLTLVVQPAEAVAS